MTDRTIGRPRRARALGVSVEALEAREVLSTATMQLINTANLPGGKVDIYANNVRIANDLSARAATAFLSVPAEKALKLDVVDFRAANNVRPLATQTVRLAKGQAMVGVMAGTPGPKGDFSIAMASGGKSRAARTDATDILVFNGMAGSPRLDLRVENGSNVADDAGFRQFGAAAKYQSLRSADVDLEVMLGNGRTQVAEFDANLLRMRGQAMVLVATGRMQDGPGGIGLLAVQPSGQATPLPLSATDIQGSDGSDFFVVTSQVDGITQVINSADGSIREFVAATSPTVTIDAGAGDNGVAVYNPNVSKLVDVNIRGGQGKDVLYVVGDEGDDNIVATQDGDRVSFATGFGRFSYTGLDQINVFGQLGNDRIDLSGVRSPFASVIGGDGDDTILGTAGDDYLSGDEGNDTIFGGEGNDTIFGGNGDDRIEGQAGDDRLYGDPGFDLLIDTLGVNILIDPDDLDGDGRDDRDKA